MEDVYLNTGKIIVRARYLESQLKAETGSKACGLHDVVSGMADSEGIATELIKKLRFVASVRNNAAHDVGFDITPENLSAFNAACDEIEAYFAWKGHDEDKGAFTTFGSFADMFDDKVPGDFAESLSRSRSRSSADYEPVKENKKFVPESSVKKNARKALHFGLELAILFFKSPHR